MDTRGGTVDPYQDLQNTAREVAKTLAAKTAPTAYTADDGTVVQGWRVETVSSWDKEDHFSRTSFRETWGSTLLILATDGSLYHFHENREQRETGPLKHERSLWLQSQQELVGSRGKPFSEIKAKLERLPWTM